MIDFETKLNLPDAEGFQSKKLHIPYTEIIKLSEERLPFLNAQPDYEQKRLRGKCRKRFRLMNIQAKKGS